MMNLINETRFEPSESRQMRIRVNTGESAFVYSIMESYEGTVSYSTIDPVSGACYRDLELRVPTGFLEEVAFFLDRLKGVVHVLEEHF